jgi:hypothetical protein
MATQVPQQYVSLIQEMAKATGLPYNVIAAQANLESGFNANAVSPSDAQGWLQFLTSTYNSVAAQAGVPEGTEFNPADEAKAYDVYMKQLLNEEGGSVRNALAAYNAGPGDLAAGQGYASEILNAAGSGNITVPTTGGSGISTTSASGGSSGPFPFGNLDPLNWVYNNVAKKTQQDLESTFAEIWKDVVAKFGDWFIRIGLILLGVVVLYAGLRSLTGIRASSVVQVVAPESTAAQGVSKAATATRQARSNPKGS